MFFSNLAIGQKNDDASRIETAYEKTSFLNIGLGGSFSSVLDQGISPLFYDGIGGAAVIATMDDTEKLFFQTMLRFDFNSISSAVSGGEMYSYRIEGLVDIFIKRYRLADTKVKVDPGLSLQYKWILRSHLFYSNNSQHVENSLMLGPSLHNHYSFDLFGRSFKLGSMVRLPLLSYNVRPIYASTKFPETVQINEPSWFDYLKGGSFYGWGSFFAVNTQSYVSYGFNKNKNAIKLEYFWTYESLQAENPIQSGQHALIFSLMFSL